ncbi:tail protein X [Camelimonas lactis]|uniref:Tail protein X n=1 Tax=Camelimonas lactis TaxID=659006 RepID=A0A4R2GZ88_9HYPH|nr:tail protein X [Camelimonas lactis]TCO15232.1 tail protein X [Camelimonas lactis]
MSHLLHTVGVLERWDHIAWRYYGDASNYAPIIAANRDLFADSFSPLPEILPVGTQLRIPVLPPSARRVAPEDLPPWFR